MGIAMTMIGLNHLNYLHYSIQTRFVGQHGNRFTSLENGMPTTWLKMNIPEFVKKLMIYQATGETVLHRAARLGYQVIVIGSPRIIKHQVIKGFCQPSSWCESTDRANCLH